MTPARNPPPARGDPPSEPRTLRKNQQRALTAYRWAEEAKESGEFDEYETAVQTVAAALLRSGFAVAVSVLERERDRNGFKRLLDNLANRALPGIANASSAEWPTRVRALADVTLYMQATRELIALFGWLRRACRALGAENAP